jgi:mycothiol system anti-sigma-R factor
MSCKSVQSKLSAYLDGEMSGTEMMNIRAHVNQCRACQSELEGLKSVQMILRGMPAGPEAPAMLPERITQSLATKNRSYVRLSLVLAIPAIVFAIAFYRRPVPSAKVQDRDLAMNRQLASDQMIDAGNDSTSGASLGHFASFEGH